MATPSILTVRILDDFWGICWLQKEFISFRFTLMIFNNADQTAFNCKVVEPAAQQQQKKLGRLNKRLIKVREDDRTERKGVCQGSELSFASA